MVNLEFDLIILYLYSVFKPQFSKPEKSVTFFDAFGKQKERMKCNFLLKFENTQYLVF